MIGMDNSSFLLTFPLTIARRERIAFTADTDDSCSYPSQPGQPPTMLPYADESVNAEL
jgi:hypothetical protein